MHLLRIRSLAKQDIQEIVDYYEENAPHIVDVFLEKLYVELESIRENPEIFQKTHKSTRVSYLKNFPFGVHFILLDDTIHVLAVLHTSRNPKMGENREF